MVLFCCLYEKQSSSDHNIPQASDLQSRRSTICYLVAHTAGIMIGHCRNNAGCYHHILALMESIPYSSHLTCYEQANHTASIFGSTLRSPIAVASDASLKIGPGCAMTRQKTATMTILMSLLARARQRSKRQRLKPETPYTPSKPMNSGSLCINGPLYPSLNSSIRYAHRIKISTMARARKPEKILKRAESCV